MCLESLKFAFFLLTVLTSCIIYVDAFILNYFQRLDCKSSLAFPSIERFSRKSPLVFSSIEPDLVSQYLDARTGLGKSDAIPVRNFAQSLLQAKGNLLDALDQSDGIVSIHIKDMCQSLVSVNPVGSPLNCRDLIHGSWLHATTSIPGLPFQSLCSIKQAFSTLSHSEDRDDSFAEYIDNVGSDEQLSKPLKVLGRITNFDNDDDRRPQLKYESGIILADDCGGTQKVCIKGNALKRSADTMELQHDTYWCGSIQLENCVKRSKHLLRICYIDQALMIINADGTENLTTETIMVLVKRATTFGNQ